MKKSKVTLEELAPNVGNPIGSFVEEYVVKPVYDADGVQASSAIGKDGLEYPDPVPLAAPLGYEPPLGLGDLLELFVRRSREKDNDWDIEETEEEANDFDIENEDIEVVTEYERVFLPKEGPVATAGQGVIDKKAEMDTPKAAEGGPQAIGAPPTPLESAPKVT